MCPPHPFFILLPWPALLIAFAGSRRLLVYSRKRDADVNLDDWQRTSAAAVARKKMTADELNNFRKKVCFCSGNMGVEERLC
jgi:hypothetical protein